jgi:hypothetical protein
MKYRNSVFRNCLLFLGVFLHGAPAWAGPVIGNCPILPEDSIWNVPVDTLPVDTASDTYVNSIGRSAHAHADFGSGIYEGGPIGIPFISVPENQAGVNVTFDYDDESDHGLYPIPSNAPIEGGSQSDGDRHVLILEQGSCILYELFAAYPQGNDSWSAGSGAIFDLRSHALRPAGWTSADAAGLPILPGLVRYDEVAAGEITHAIRFTVPRTRNTYVWPARHQASSSSNAAFPPMGQRFRLKASVDISGYPADVQVILRAMKKYGIILADNGSSWFFSGAPDDRWNNDTLHEMSRLTGNDFEAVDVSSLQISPDSDQARVGPVPKAAHADYDGDGSSDIAVWRPATGFFYVLTSGSGFAFDHQLAYQLGLLGDIPLSGDFDGDQQVDFVVWRPSDGNWYFRLSGTAYSQITAIQWGLPGDAPYTGDFDGDGKADLAVYRESIATFFVLRSSSGYNRDAALAGNPSAVAVVHLGGPGYDIITGNFSSNSRDDLVSVWQPYRFWTIKTLADQFVSSLPWGYPGDTPLGCDWDGNGISDRVIVRVAPTNLLDWYIASDRGPVYTTTFGSLGDQPRCRGDFDGDGSVDHGVFRPTSGEWFLFQSASQTAHVYQFGLPGDIPLS